MAALGLEGQREVRDLPRRANGADGLLADIPVLAEDAPQIAQAEEDRTRAAPAPETVLLAEMRKGAGNPSIAPGVAHTGQVGHSIHATVARTRAAILQLAQPGQDSLGHFTGAIKRQVRRLEWVEQEAGIDSRQGRYPDHGAPYQLID